MRNIEAKYRCPDLPAVHRRAVRMGAREAGVLRQQDTFFRAAAGRLKLRESGDGSGELIAYRRADAAAARASDYLLFPTDRPAELAAALVHALGPAGVVRKTRRLLLHGSTRIHLDEVEGLGNFAELETVIAGQPESEARAELERVAAALGLPEGAREAAAYVDLLLARESG